MLPVRVRGTTIGNDFHLPPNLMLKSPDPKYHREYIALKGLTRRLVSSRWSLDCLHSSGVHTRIGITGERLMCRDAQTRMRLHAVPDGAAGYPIS
jgi:hypothetical protein